MTAFGHKMTVSIKVRHLVFLCAARRTLTAQVVHVGVNVVLVIQRSVCRTEATQSTYVALAAEKPAILLSRLQLDNVVPTLKSAFRMKTKRYVAIKRRRILARVQRE
jgi:hypothetical protein